MPGQRDVVQRGDRLRGTRQRPQTHAPADVAIGSDLVERGQREPVDDLFGAVVEPAAGHRPFEPDARRVGAPHAHAHVVAAVQARAGDARDQHRRDRAGRLRLSVGGDGVAVHLQPARPQAEGVHGEDAGIPGRGRHRSRDLPVGLAPCRPATPSPRRGRPGSGRPARGACPRSPGLCLRWQRYGGRRRRTPRSPAGPPSMVTPTNAWGPVDRSSSPGRRLASVTPNSSRWAPSACTASSSCTGIGWSGGGGVHAGRHRQHRRAGVDHQRPLERYPPRPPSVRAAERAADAKPARRRPRRRRHRVPAAAEQLSGGDPCRGGAGQRQQTGSRVATTGHRSGSLVQRYPGTSSGRGASAPAPAAANTETGPTWARRLSPGSRISRFA